MAKANKQSKLEKDLRAALSPDKPLPAWHDLLRKREQTKQREEGPPLSDISLPEVIWNVPFVATSFVGREHEITELQSLLARPEVRFITVLGPAGMGKTRLAIQMALVTREHFAQGVCFLSLESVRDESSIMPMLVQSLGIQLFQRDPSSPEEYVYMALRQRQMLLIFDHLEHVVSASLWLERVLEKCPSVKILVTSRIALHRPAEQLFAVDPLPLPNLDQASSPDLFLQQPAIDLFVQRTQVMLPAFQVNEDNIFSIAEICTQLGGIPLAIELAAAHMKLFSPQGLLTQLHQQHLGLLNSEARTVSDQQEMLYETIRWSYDLLDEREQRLFRQLALFEGSFSLQAVEQMFGNEVLPDVVDITLSLLDKSLIQRVDQHDSEERLMLHETTRQYGLERLKESLEFETCQWTYAFYYLELLRQAEHHLRDALQGIWLERLDQEVENLRAALSWFIEQQLVNEALRFCEAFGKFCGLRGYWSEELHWITVTLDLARQSDADPLLYARVLRRAGHLAYRLRHLSQARTWLEESVQISRTWGDTSNLAGALNSLGWTLYRQKEITLAGRLLHECVDVARRSGDSWSLANALEALGRFLYQNGNLEDAQQLVQESVTLLQETGDRESQARVLMTLVSIEIALGHLTDAATHAGESLVIARSLGTRPLLALVLDCIGNVALFRREYDRAKRMFRRRIKMAYELGDMPTVAKMHLSLGEIALAQADYAQAQSLVQKSLRFFQAQGDNPGIALALGMLGAIACSQHHVDEAQSLYYEALRLDQAVGHRSITGIHLAGLARVAYVRKAFVIAAQFLGCATNFVHPQKDMIPFQREMYEQTLEDTHRRLGKEGFKGAWQRGKEMTVEQALGLLSGETTPVSSEDNPNTQYQQAETAPQISNAMFPDDPDDLSLAV